jgi:cytochrome c-type biogenesis protein CcmE
MWGLQDRAAYFFTPADIAAGKAADGRPIRLGGMVEKGSLRQEADGVTIDFIVEDGISRVPVRFTGITPDLFREGSGVVAEGRMRRQTMLADNILAKHDERYMPPELGNQAAEHAAAKTLK